MAKSLMPQARQMERPQGLQWELSPIAVENWMPDIEAAATAEDNTITMFGPIGETVTDSRIAAALRSIGANKDVVVHINSPGGDFVQGVGIYNILREHKGNVQVKILGMAASAASVIAMAGDEILIARSASFFVHNTQGLAAGDRHSVRELSNWMEDFDLSMAEIYAARSGKEVKAVQKLMDQTSLFRANVAIEHGFADGFLPSDEVKQGANGKGERIAAHLLDTALAKAGMPRSERRALLQEYKAGTPSAAGVLAGTPSAAEDSTPSAVVDYLAALQQFSLSMT